jgi:hypothetical protein
MRPVAWKQQYDKTTNTAILLILTMSSSLSQNNDTTVTTKWGTMIVLKNDNYAAWRNLVQLTLTSANAWSIVTGNEQPPHLANQLEYYDKRKTIAM